MLPSPNLCQCHSLSEREDPIGSAGARDANPGFPLVGSYLRVSGFPRRYEGGVSSSRGNQRPFKRELRSTKQWHYPHSSLVEEVTLELSSLLVQVARGVSTG